MRCHRVLFGLLLLAVLSNTSWAGLIFGKKATKPDPATRVPELLTTVKSDGDENKRAEAAEELRQYDAATFTDIIPVLVEVLLKDPKPAVRGEAAQSLAKLRPINQQAGAALEQAVAKDGSMRVRLQARSALLMYHMSGYHSGKKDEPPPGQSKEPPLATPTTTGAPPVLKTTPTPPAPSNGRLVPVPAQSKEPPLAPPPSSLKPMPTAPLPSPLVPAVPPPLQTPPASPNDQGPELPPP
jgi:hypothetical protein